MKYGYIGNDKSETIREYRIIGDKIITYFLDGEIEIQKITVEEEGQKRSHILIGNFKIEEYSKETEEKIIKKMINQAIERNFYAEEEDILSESAINGLLVMFFYYSSRVSAYYDLNSLAQSDKVFFSLMNVICNVGAIYNLIKYLKKDAEIKELKKYHIYLKIKKELEEFKDVDFYYGLRKAICKMPTINTLDKYKLAEIEFIKENLECHKREIEESIVTEKVKKLSL